MKGLKRKTSQNCMNPCTEGQICMRVKKKNRKKDTYV